MNFVRSGVLVSLAILAGACSSGPRNGDPKPPASSDEAVSLVSNGSPLTREMAVARSKQVANVSYSVWIGLTSAADFEGRAVIQFELRPKAAEAGKQVFLDFAEGTIRSLSLNGTARAQSDYDGKRLFFGVNELAVGMNRVDVAFTGVYSPIRGLQKFVDPVDQQAYVFSRTAPFGAQRIFPCFDQPDLRGSLELTVEAPEGWEVISNTREREVTKVDGRRSWAFPPSPKLSPQFFALFAGPYTAWKSEAEGVPLRVFVRRSLAPAAAARGELTQVQAWFNAAARGIDFFGLQFGYPYPYSKLDQIFLPEAGSAAAATLVLPEEHWGGSNQRLGYIQLSQMWLGGLVGNRNLGNAANLRAGLPELLATLVVTEGADSTDSSAAWLEFSRRFKRPVYLHDLLGVTDSGETSGEAANGSDPLGMARPVSVLKQLRFFMEEDEFRDGLQRYVLKYALRTPSLTDFLKIMSQAYGKDLVAWNRAWMQVPGLNTVTAQWTCALPPPPEKPRKRSKPPEPRINRFEVIQGSLAPTTPLRPHRMSMAFFSSAKEGGKKPYEVIDVTYSAAKTTLVQPLNKPCPELVFLNWGDQDQVKVILDPVSQKALEEGWEFQNPMARLQAWQWRWEAVLEGRESASAYGERALRELRHEKDPEVLGAVLETLARASARDLSVVKLLDGKARGDFRTRLEALIRKEYAAAPARSRQQSVWFKALTEVATTSESRALLSSLLKAPAGVPGGARHEALGALARAGGLSAIAAGDMGPDAYAEIEVQAADGVIKKKWLNEILKGAPVKDSVMARFHIVGQEDLVRDEASAYFELLGKSQGHDARFLARFAELMYPAFCDPALIERTDSFLKTASGLAAPVAHAIRAARDRDAICVRARGQASSSKTGQ